MLINIKIRMPTMIDILALNCWYFNIYEQYSINSELRGVKHLKRVTISSPARFLHGLKTATHYYVQQKSEIPQQMFLWNSPCHHGAHWCSSYQDTRECRYANTFFKQPCWRLSWGYGFSLLVSNFVYTYILIMLAAKALASLCICTASPESLLFDYDK